MKPIRLVTTGVLLLLLGTTIPTYAQGKPHQQGAKASPQASQGKAARQRQPQRAQGQQQQRNPKRAQQPRTPQPQSAAKRPAQRPPQTFGGVFHGGVRPSGPTYGGVHPSGVPQRQAQVHRGILQSRARSWNDDHRTWKQRGGYNGYRVPEDRFRLYFGSNHFFRLGRLPMVFVGGYPRFQYDGYWVTFVDPWPDTWPPTWYETDDIYLDYTDDGYYVYDRKHPGIGIAVTISF